MLIQCLFRLSWSRRDTWWLNLDDVTFVSEQWSPKFKDGEKVAINKKLADRYGLQGDGTILMSLSWKEFNSGDNTWFLGAGCQSIQTTDRLYKLNTSDKFFPEESLALVTNELVDPKDYNYMTGTLVERSRWRKYYLQLKNRSNMLKRKPQEISIGLEKFIFAFIKQ